MFGEKEMYGQVVQNIDSKTRIILPAFTKREEGEELLLIEDEVELEEDIKIHRIVKLEKLNEIFDKKNEEILKATNPKEIRRLKTQLLNISRLIVRTLKVEKQGKVILGEQFKNVKQVNVIGAKDHVILEIKK